MTNKTIRMELLSDMCPASGDGFAGVVDTDVCYDENGVPYIPGKRLKGCLRECGIEILSVDDSRENIDKFNKLFGETGKLIPGEMAIGNGYLEGYENIVKSITPDIHRSEIAEIFTSSRTRTKMEGGKALKGTLRIVRVLNKRDVFEFPVTLDENLEEFLKMCVKSLRSMGLNRSRGLGEVSCELVDVNAENAENTNGAALFVEGSESEAQLSYIITLPEPVISAERSGKPHGCEEYIFGSAVLGAIASKYIKKHVPEPESAYRDKNFRRIFLSGRVTFTAAMPYKNGEVYYPAPHSLETNKLENILSDDSSGIQVETGSAGSICKKLGGFVSIDEKGTVKRLSPEKTVFLHHARPDDKSIAHAISAESNSKGKFYQYESLSAGQAFTGRIIGSDADLKTLANLFADDNTLQIGRSRTAQYGKAKISACGERFSTGKLNLKNGDEFRLIAVTPVILENEHGINSTDLNLIAESLGKEFEIVKSFCTDTVAAGYYGKWLLPKTQSRAIAEGSVVVLKYNGSGIEISDGFMGIRTAEGFGQVRYELVPKQNNYRLYQQNATTSGKDAGNDSELWQKVRKLRSEKDAVSQGMEYGEKCVETAPQNAALQRIATAAKTSEGFGEFAGKLCRISQPKQQRAAFAFSSDEKELYFMTDATRLAQSKIETLLKTRAAELFSEEPEKEHYDLFVKYLTAAATRIMQIRRSREANGRKEARQ